VAAAEPAGPSGHAVRQAIWPSQVTSLRRPVRTFIKRKLDKKKKIVKMMGKMGRAQKSPKKAVERRMELSSKTKEEKGDVFVNKE